MNLNADTQPVLPTLTADTAENTTVPRFHRDSVVEFSIKNHSSLQKLSERFEDDVERPDAPTTSTACTFYNQLNIGQRIEIDDGSPFQIDVQSDFRFVTQYLMYTTAREFPDLDIKSYPYTSLLSIVAYKLALIYGHFLICDIQSRSKKSDMSRPYTNNPVQMEFLNELRNCPVPPDVMTLLEYIAPVQDTQRLNLHFIPSLAGFDFNHDFGFTVPVLVFLIIHNIFATQKSNSDPNYILCLIYNSTICKIDQRSYTISNLFGGAFYRNNKIEICSNWFNIALETFINPVVQRYMYSRPTFARIPTTVPAIASADALNGYDYVFGFPITNKKVLCPFLKDVGNFYSKQHSNLTRLGTVLSKTTGVTIMTHSIENYVLPTWHKLDSIKLQNSNKDSTTYDQISPSDYAKFIEFYVQNSRYEKTSKFSDAYPVVLDLELTSNLDYIPQDDPIKYRKFKENLYEQPRVLWFQPYDVSTQSIELALALGLKIITDEADGVTIPLPNITLNLTLNNSRYLQGAIPISHVLTYLPDSTKNHTVCIGERKLRTLQKQPLTVSVRDCSVNVLPVMVTTNVISADFTSSGLFRTPGFNSIDQGVTYYNWKSNGKCPIPSKQVPLWSSYRHVVPSTLMGKPSVYFYYTLRALTGTCVPLCSTKHPSDLIPS